MEKRAVAPLVLGGAGLVLAVAIGVLVVKVRAGSPTVAVSAADQSRASARVSLPAERAQGSTPEPPPPRPEVAGESPPEPSAPPPPPSPSSVPAPGEPGTATDSTGKQLGPEEWTELAEKMVEANRLYDRGDYEAAGRAAEEILEKHPANVKMLRIATSSACIQGDAGAARAHYDKLPASDQEQIARRCRRYGVEF